MAIASLSQLSSCVNLLFSKTENSRFKNPFKLNREYTTEKSSAIPPLTFLFHATRLIHTQSHVGFSTRYSPELAGAIERIRSNCAGL